MTLWTSYRLASGVLPASHVNAIGYLIVSMRCLFMLTPLLPLWSWRVRSRSTPAVRSVECKRLLNGQIARRALSRIYPIVTVVPTYIFAMNGIYHLARLIGILYSIAVAMWGDIKCSGLLLGHI